jgi:hypothetical protein
MPMIAVFDGEQATSERTQLDARPVRIYDRIPPLRTSVLGPQGLFEPEPQYDGQRIEFQKRLWHSQDAMLRGRDRQIEENIRMLCGQQWTVWNEVLGKYVDITRYFSDEERRWRQMPVMNRLLLWYMLLHARMTENPPIVTFLPATSDRADAELAEVMDTVWKTIWRQADMNEVIDDLVAWMIPGGRAYLKNRIDPDMGDLVPLRAPGALRLLGPDGQPIMGEGGVPIERYLDAAPYTRKGEPVAREITITTDGQLVLPEPEYEREGAIVVDALSGLEVRFQWGPGKFHRKAWHIHRTYSTPEDVYKNFGVEVEPEVFGDEADAIAELQRLHFGAGYYGQAGGREETAGLSNAAKEGFVELFEGWYCPSDFDGMERTPDSPGGRLLITTRNRCLRDGARYAPFPHTSPIHAFDFVNVKGRPSGTSAQEMMNGPARSRNRFFGQVFQHTSLVANPIKMVDKATGLTEGMVPNRPGAEVFLNMQGITGDPIRYTRPPDLGSDVYRVLEMLTREMDDLGNIPGAEGRPPTADPSGELVKELRFNSDRFVAPTQRRLVIGLARLCEDWQVMLPLIWQDEKLLRVGGTESIAQTVMVQPDLFATGKVDIVPDLESMLPEGRGEREQRYWRWYQQGVFGQPGSPEANQLYLELSHFPHLNREALPGGVDRSTAEEENGKLVRGDTSVPVLEVYDHAVHLMVHRRFMKSTQYLKLPLPVQEAFVQHTKQHEMALMLLQQQQLIQQLQMQSKMAALMPPQQPDDGTAPANNGDE